MHDEDRQSTLNPGSFPDAVPDDHATRLNSPRRLATLEATGLMDSLPDEAFDRAVRLATRITSAPVGLVSIVDGQRQFFKARSGLDSRSEFATGTPLSHSFCQFVVSQDRVMRVEDSRSHSLLAQSRAHHDLGAVAYLGVPVHAPNGEALGSFCAIDHSPRDWTSADIEALEDLAGVLEAEIALRQTVDERQLLIEELNHRVKNVFAILSGMIRLARHGEETADTLASALEARVQALGRAHELIVPIAEINHTVGQSVPLASLFSSLLEPYVGPGSERVVIEGPGIELGPAATTNLALAIHELATNAVKYGALASAGGRLSITWTREDQELRIRWREIRPEPEDTQLTEPGFGSRLISICLQSQLHGEVRTEVSDTGWARKITIPLNALEA